MQSESMENAFQAVHAHQDGEGDWPEGRPEDEAQPDCFADAFGWEYDISAGGCQGWIVHGQVEEYLAKLAMG